MRLSFSVALIALVIATTPAWAEDVIANSAVKAVTVYTDRATVTREATIDLPAGASTLVINGLPESLFTDSLRAEGTAQASVILGALESKLISSAELAAPRERELNAKLIALQDQRALLDADQQSLTQKQQFLTTLSQQANLRARENIAAIELKPDQWKSAAEAVGTGLSDTLRALAGKAVELRTLDEQIAAVQTELAQLQTGAKNSYQVRVPLEAKEATRLTFSITYQLSGATWQPVYDARLDTTTGKIALTQFGEVHQQTGEDWGQVKLTLSTAQPAQGAALPPLDPMWVNLFDPRRQAYMEKSASVGFATARSNVVGQAMEMAVMDSAAPMVASPPEPQKAMFQAAQINTGGYVSEYQIAGKSDVPADGSARKVMVGNLDVSSDVMVKVKPQIASSAYLIAVTKLGGDAPLLPGNASLFRDGSYVGSISLPLLRVGEETDMGFGIDDNIVVKQRVLKDETGETGVIARDKTRTRHTITEVQNLHKTPVKVVVLQTVPAPQDEQIKLAILPDLTLKGYDDKVDNIAGQMRWTLNLQPQQKTELGLGWTLSWPKDQDITGLPF